MVASKQLKFLETKLQYINMKVTQAYNYLKEYSIKHPLRFVIYISFIIRLIAVIFAGGFGMFDDHFLVIEQAQSWLNGFDSGNWFVNNYSLNTSGRSILYPALQFVLFKVLHVVGIDSALTKMFIVRLLHAFYSLTAVYLVYKIINWYTNSEKAVKGSLLFSLFWMMPWCSVRNLVEVISIPPLLYACWLVLKNTENQKISTALVIGLMLELAFAFRYQTLFFSAGLLLALIIKKRFKELLWLSVGFLVPFVILHGWVEYLMCTVPFGKLWYYFHYNVINSESYSTQPFYNYFLFLVGVFIPPVGIFLWLGVFRSYKRCFEIFLAFIFFFVFHSYFPNKQERFIYTMIPFFVILGYIGWDLIMQNSKFWNKRKILVTRSWQFFWAINLSILFLFSTYYSKKSLVMTMHYLSKKHDVRALITEKCGKDPKRLPMFYLEKWVNTYKVTDNFTTEQLKDSLLKVSCDEYPNYLILETTAGENISESRLAPFNELFDDITYETYIQGSLVDRIHALMNPRVAAKNYYIYKLGTPRFH